MVNSSALTACLSEPRGLTDNRCDMPFRATRSARPAPRWSPSAFLRWSAALHAGAAAGALAVPGWWPAWLALVVGNHLVLSTVGLLPRSGLLGANLTRLPAAAAARGEVALTFDDGPNPDVTPRVLDMLDAVGARATFFCVGEAVQRHPALAREIVRRGHLIENHTASHPNAFAAYGWGGMTRQVAEGQRLIRQVTGRTPRFFRAVAGLRNPLLDPILTRQNLRLAAWTRRGFDTRCPSPALVLRRLTRNLAAGDILLLHDGHAACTGRGDPVVLVVLPHLLAQLRARGLHSVTLAAACDTSAELTTLAGATA